jgi:hypothetical protein
MHLNQWLHQQSFPGDQNGDPVTVTHWVSSAYAKEIGLRLKVGAVFADHGFCSTDHWHGQLTMKIKVPKGAKAAAVRAWSVNKPEDEIILAPNSKFVIEGLAQDKAGKQFVMARYLFPDEPDWFKA